MSQAANAARARTADMGQLDPIIVDNAPGTIPFYPAPGLADSAITLEPRLPLLNIEAATEPAPPAGP